MKLLKVTIVIAIFLPMIMFGQTRIVVKDNLTGVTRKLKKGKLVGLITVTNDTIQYKGKDAYPDNSYWYLKNFTDSSLTIEFKRTAETKIYLFKNIKILQFQRNETTGAPIGLFTFGISIVVASPFVGISERGYDFQKAATVLGVGSGILAIVYLTTRNRELRDYSIVTTK